MADIRCGKFELVRRDAATSNLTFRARLTPAPNAQWSAVFYERQAVERLIGNFAVARIVGDAIEFEAPEILAESVAQVVRRCIERTNPEAAKREAAESTQREAQRKQDTDEWNRLKDRFQAGIVASCVSPRT